MKAVVIVRFFMITLHEDIMLKQTGNIMFHCKVCNHPFHFSIQLKILLLKSVVIVQGLRDVCHCRMRHSHLSMDENQSHQMQVQEVPVVVQVVNDVCSLTVQTDCISH